MFILSAHYYDWKKKYTEHIEPIDSKKAGLATFRQDNLVTKNVPEQHELPTCWFAQFL